MLVLLLIACQAEDSATFGTHDVVTPGDDTGSVTTGLGTVSAPVVEATAKPTVFRVSWTTDVPAAGAVEYGVGDTFDRVIVADDSTSGLEHSALLVGLAAGRDWTLRTINEVDGGVLTSTEAALHTEPVSANLPSFAITATDGQERDGFVVCSSPAGSTAVFILDRNGEPVWWEFGAAGSLITAASMSLDGEFVEWFLNGPSPAIYRESLDGEQLESFPVPNGHHAFTALPQGGWAVAIAEVRTVGDVQVQGDRVVELDREGNELRTVWSTWDALTLDTSTSSEISPGLLDWTHLNSITFDPATNSYWLSLYSLDEVVQVDAESGETLRILGGKDATMPLSSGEPFTHQHSPIPVEGGVLMFDNGSNDTMASRAVEYTFQDNNTSYSETWAYMPDPSIFASILGNAQRFDDGGTFIAWGAAGRLTELDASGKLVWQADASLGGALGFSYLIPQLGGATR